ncbi:WbqC family protein [Clostridium perfringens]|uniref:WbqC family protein n=1 Tax=Clostridium perfringens TaxID=1502 RepID=UPI0023F6A8E9|nr:WbqC family protein [Clostridium perfringens]WEV22677.1 WbqC family protein [Clostridium perfringens D]
MIVGIMQPYFLPYIGYWQLLNAVDKYVIYDDVNFIKGGWINRNRMLINGDAKLFNIQMKGASPNKLINEIEVSNNIVWKKKLLKTIENSYKKAPFYTDVFPIIEEIINSDECNLAKYLANSIKKVCDYLNIETELIVSSTLYKDNNLKAQEKVIAICKELKATEYYNAIGGQELYSYEEFKDVDIKLSFLKSNEIKYKQLKDEFVANLSILDVLMFNSINDIKNFLNQYELI